MKLFLFVSLCCCCTAFSIGCDEQPVDKTPDRSEQPDNEVNEYPDGIDPNQTSDDPSYGYTRENPIKVGGPGSDGPASERVYFRHLRDHQFKPFRFRRLGSAAAGPDGHVLDLFELTSSDGKKHKVYIDMYHPDIHPFHVKAPNGMYFWK